MAVDIKMLKIGSHVAICGGERVRVTAVRSNGIITTTLGDMDESNLSPIPLTSELLKELGFEFKDNGYNKMCRKEAFEIKRRNHALFWTYQDCINFEYLHELEAVYYHIYGEELIKD